MAKAKEDPNNYFNSPVGHIRDRIKVNPDKDIPRQGMFVSLNGFAFQIVPGKEVDIPRPVRLMLDTRIKTETEQDENGNSYTRDIPRFTYQLIKEGVNLDAEGKVIMPGAVPVTEPAAPAV
jgi:hypothetical protein